MPFDLDRPTDDEHVNVTRALHDVNVAGHVHDATDDDERADVDQLARDHAALLIEHEQLVAKYDNLGRLVDEYLDAHDEFHRVDNILGAATAWRALRAARDR